ncbi:MAG: lysine--tRNA ligase, partial [Clostridia bacterium]|nr:lysine--tRNA ligase [Clostridia bacterium]
PKCGRDTTKILSLSDDSTEAEYECECGHRGHFDFKTDFNCKLAWKIDWPMRWLYEGVDFEPGGKDHASPTGSYQTSKIISKKIFGYEAPLFQGYEFIGIKGVAGKMSGSSGLNLTPDTLLKIYQPEVILWLYSKTEPTKAFDFCFDDGILRQYFEFDKMYTEYKNGEAGDYNSAIMYNCDIEGRSPDTVPMSLLVQLGSIVNFNESMLETVFKKIGMNYTASQFSDRLDRAKTWLEQCAPEQVNKFRSGRNWEVYETLSDDEKTEIKMLFDYISNNKFTLDDLNAELYAIPKKVFGENLPDKELRTVQGAFFKNVYRLLIDKERGPRLYLFLGAFELSEYAKLLDFSTPKTDDEIKAEQMPEAEAVEAEEATQQFGEPDPVPEQKPEIDIDAFEALDMCVCQIMKAETVRKSNACLKLTLDDGMGGRTIMSSIKSAYTPEQLVGKKIIVIANLKPTRICNVKSEGMLIAATNNACGCKVIFVDDSVPVGTRIH